MFKNEKSAIQYIAENKAKLLDEMYNYETRTIYTEGEKRVFVRKINKDIAIGVNRYGEIKN